MDLRKLIKRQPDPKSKKSSAISSLNAVNGNQLELCHANYTAYICLQIFDAHYLPWLKECYGPDYLINFGARLDHLSKALGTCFPKYGNFKRRITVMAKRNAFNLLRKLKVTVEEVRQCSDGANCHLKSQCLRVRITTKNTVDGEVSTYLTSLPIQVYSNFSMFLDFPAELNDSKTTVLIEFLIAESNSKKAHQPDESSLTDKEVILQVYEYEISGFTGHNGKCRIMDQITQEMIDVKLNLSWHLKVESIQKQLKWGNIVAGHFSCALLATGAYYWKFYNSLYSALLLDEKTETKSLGCINEVAFILGSVHKQTLANPLIALLNKRILAFNSRKGVIECCLSECDSQYRLLHVAFLILEHLSIDEQGELMARLRDAAFVHLFRFHCSMTSIERMVALQRIALRRLTAIVKKKKFCSAKEMEPFIEYITETLIDTVKQGQRTQSQEELTQTQDDAVWLLARFCQQSKGQKMAKSFAISETPKEKSVYTSVVEKSEGKEKSRCSTSDTLKTVSEHLGEQTNFLIDLKQKAFQPEAVIERLFKEEFNGEEYYEPMMVLLNKVTKEILRKETDGE